MDGISIAVGALLQRCLVALDTGHPNFEQDLEAAVAAETALVADIGNALATLVT